MTTEFNDRRVAMRSTTITLAIGLLLCAMAAFAQQTDLYSQITPLETSVNNGTASAAQQLDLARLYNRVGRFYEAQTITDRLLATDPNNADVKSVHDIAATGVRDVQIRKVADAEVLAHRSGTTNQDLLNLADAYFESGSYAAAAEIYGHIPTTEESRDQRLRYARALAWSNQYDAAERTYTVLLKEQSTPDLQLEYGRGLSGSGASEASVDQLTDIYNNTHTEDAVIALANAKAWSGDRAGAVQLLDQFAQNNPNATHARQLADQL